MSKAFEAAVEITKAAIQADSRVTVALSAVAVSNFFTTVYGAFKTAENTEPKP